MFIQEIHQIKYSEFLSINFIMYFLRLTSYFCIKQNFLGRNNSFMKHQFRQTNNSYTYLLINELKIAAIRSPNFFSIDKKISSE